MIQFNLSELINQWSLIGLPFLLLVIGALAARFVVKADS